jgi:hypothetical protein
VRDVRDHSLGGAARAAEGGEDKQRLRTKGQGHAREFQEGGERWV